MSNLITFVSERPFDVGRVELSSEAAAHARARRVRDGDPVRLLDGQGRMGDGRVIEVGKAQVIVGIERVATVGRPSPLEVIVPVADRDRMLLAAEKCAEIQVTAWRPAWFERSRSVTPRGEGEKFREKVGARMRSALEQSGSAWMPVIHAEVTAGQALENVPHEWKRLILHSDGTSMAPHIFNGPMALAVGPEGGFDDVELHSARSAGWTPVSLGATTLRFETAIIAAASLVRALQR